MTTWSPFRPRPGSDKALYSGKIWIDFSSFRKVRMLLVQENCSGSILSNKELQFFDLVDGPGGERFNLLVKNDVEQKIMAAGREFLLERQYRFLGYWWRWQRQCQEPGRGLIC